MALLLDFFFKLLGSGVYNYTFKSILNTISLQSEIRADQSYFTSLAPHSADRRVERGKPLNLLVGFLLCTMGSDSAALVGLLRQLKEL